MAVRLRIASNPSLKVRMTPVFPANVIGSNGLSIVKENGQFVFSLDWTTMPDDFPAIRYDDLQPAITAAGKELARTNIGLGNLTIRESSGTIEVAASARGYRVTSALNGALTFNLGPAILRHGPFTVALDGADPFAHAITVDFNGSETCQGAGSYEIKSPYQVVTFYPREDGSGFYIG